MSKDSNFKVDPKLASLLGETYKSTEEAIKELIDNAYDADSENIWITLPEILTEEPIITIKDDGTGMKEQEVRTEYLKIASSRFSRKGEKTLKKSRVVKGRKGIGKFSGLMVADMMHVSTKAGGKHTTITILKSELAKGNFDLEQVRIPTDVEDCPNEEHGTLVTLKGLNQNLSYPNPDKLKQILAMDYGRVADLSIFVNGVKVGVQDFGGKTIELDLAFEDDKKAKVIYTITEKPVRSYGLVYRVGNKIVGRAINFLKDDELIPEKLKRRVVGEIICDDLEEFVTADWGAIIDNSKLNEQIQLRVREELCKSLEEVFKTDMHLARLRYRQKIDRELQKLPEHKREFARRSLQRVLEKFYDEPEDKVNSIISVMVDALEKDFYWSVIQQIQESRDGDVEKFADALSEFGFLEMSLVAGQAINRLKFLDELDILINSPETLEATIHKALENNLWVLGSEYNLIFSNQTLAASIKAYLDKEFKGERANKRPDLFLGQSVYRKYLLIEFKRPSFTVGREAERQALEYRDDLNSVIHNKKIEIIVLGGKVDSKISSHNERDDVQLLTYTDIVSSARNNLEWLLYELKDERSSVLA